MEDKIFVYTYTCQDCKRGFFMAKRRGGRQYRCPDCNKAHRREYVRLAVRKYRAKNG